MPVIPFTSVPAPAATPHDVIRTEQMVDDFLRLLPMQCTTGQELFGVLTRAIGYGACDPNLKAACARLQKHLTQRS